MTTPDLVPLRRISVADLPFMELPSLKIKTEEDVHAWRETQGYRDYGIFLRRLNEAVVGHALPWVSPAPSKVSSFECRIVVGPCSD